MLGTFKILNRFEHGYLLDRVIQDEGLFVYNMPNIEEKHLVSGMDPCETGAGR
jgi:hypothetical protein